MLKITDNISIKWYKQAFVGFAVLPLGIILEALFRKETIVIIVNYIILIAIMAGIVMLGRAAFKSYHRPIYVENDISFEESTSFIVLKKLIAATIWLVLFITAATVVLYFHTRILANMPDDMLHNEMLKEPFNILKEIFGEGIYLVYSTISLFFQGITIISIAYIAASAAHIEFFNSYKILAGIFTFVLIVFFENDFATSLKRIIINLFGGPGNVLSEHTGKMIGTLSLIEVITYVIIVALNVAATCYILKKTKRGNSEWTN